MSAFALLVGGLPFSLHPRSLDHPLGHEIGTQPLDVGDRHPERLRGEAIQRVGNVPTMTPECILGHAVTRRPLAPDYDGTRSTRFAHGHVYVVSGYAMWNRWMPGNVLLAFSVDGK